ncbi:MAG TPA: class D sortase [Vicinamibacteria bacterium]|nr:class D sortase [Vicinamibacteria bacterium]
MAISKKPARARTARALEHALSGFAALALGFWAWEMVGAQLHFAAQDRRLQSLAAAAQPAVERRLAAATRVEMGRTGLVGRLEIPRLNLAVIVEEGIDRGTLRRAAGHVPGTALPGEPGNIVIAAHRDTLFRPLKDIQPGDEVRFVTPDGWFEYEVVKTEVVAASRTDVLAPATEGEATLITCYPFGFVGPAPQRFVVRAARITQ